MREVAHEFDVVVVGAGPGGIAAAVTAADAGRRVALIDDSFHAGGQIWRHTAQKPPMRSARPWLKKLASARSIERMQGASVVAAPAPDVLLIETPDGAKRIGWKTLILATGARELFLPFPGWTLPHVFGAAAIQALVKAGMPVKGKRIVLAGSGPLLLAVAQQLRSNGATVPLMIEQATSGQINRFGLSLLRWPGKLMIGIGLRAQLLGTRYATDSYPLRIQPQGDQLRVDWRCGSKEVSTVCDLVGCGFGLVPNIELPLLLGCALTNDGFVQVDRQMRSSVPGIYAIGEITGIGGYDKSVLEGRLAVGSMVGQDVSTLERSRVGWTAFADRLADAFALRPELKQLAASDTIICRCEDVRRDAIERSIDTRDAKLQTRCGMGPCQGRICGPVLQQVFGLERPHVRPPIFPVRLQTLAGVEPSSVAD